MSLELNLGPIGFGLSMDLIGMYLSGRDGLMYETRVPRGPMRAFGNPLFKGTSLFFTATASWAQYLYASGAGAKYQEATFAFYILTRVFSAVFWAIVLCQPNPMAPTLDLEAKKRLWGEQRTLFIIAMVQALFVFLFTALGLVFYSIDGAVFPVLMSILVTVWIFFILVFCIRSIQLTASYAETWHELIEGQDKDVEANRSDESSEEEPEPVVTRPAAVEMRRDIPPVVINKRPIVR